jgi:hypothetical protein
MRRGNEGASLRKNQLRPVRRRTQVSPEPWLDQRERASLRRANAMSKLDVFVFRRALDRLSVVTRCSKTLTMRRFGYKGGQQKRRPERQHPGAIYRIPWIQILSTPVQSTRRCRVTPSVVSCSHELTAEDLNLNSMASGATDLIKK